MWQQTISTLILHFVMQASRFAGVCIRPQGSILEGDPKEISLRIQNGRHFEKITFQFF